MPGVEGPCETQGRARTRAMMGEGGLRSQTSYNVILKKLIFLIVPVIISSL